MDKCLKKKDGEIVICAPLCMQTQETIDKKNLDFEIICIICII
jgi:hypothetical protein